MAYRFNNNKFNGRCQILVIGANSADIPVVGNNSVSNLCVNTTSSEVIGGATFRRIIWATEANASIQIKRGANLMIVLTQAGQIDFEGMAMAIDSTASINVATMAANSFLLFELDKIFSSETSQY